MTAVIVVAVGGMVFLIGLDCCLHRRRMKWLREEQERARRYNEYLDGMGM